MQILYSILYRVGNLTFIHLFTKTATLFVHLSTFCIMKSCVVIQYPFDSTLYSFVLFCSFMCGEKYHAPTDCYTIKKWLTKCEDDSETANYITANTKDVSVTVCEKRVP